MQLEDQPPARKSNGQFGPGNPGRRHGSRNGASLAVEALLEGEVEGLTRKAISLAMAGDTTALRLCLDRIAPPRKDRAVTFDLPDVSLAADHPGALQAVLKAVAVGDLTPMEGQGLATMIDTHRRAVEMVEIEERLAKLEARAGA